MSKRLSDTEVWKKQWFFDLEDKLKLFWLYILSDCNAAGIWTANFRIAQAYLGDLDKVEAIEKLKDQITVLEDGKYWFIKDFIRFQYNYPVSPKHKLYNTLKNLLADRGLDIENLTANRVDTVLDTVSDTVSDTVKRKEKVISKRKVIEEVQGEKTEPDLPYNLDFKNTWDEWTQFRKEIKKPLTPVTINQQLKFIIGAEGDDERRACEILRQSMRNGWQGLFELKDEPKPQIVRRVATSEEHLRQTL